MSHLLRSLIARVMEFHNHAATRGVNGCPGGGPSSGPGSVFFNAWSGFNRCMLVFASAWHSTTFLAMMRMIRFFRRNGWGWREFSNNSNPLKHTWNIYTLCRFSIESRSSEDYSDEGNDLSSLGYCGSDLQRSNQIPALGPLGLPKLEPIPGGQHGYPGCTLDSHIQSGLHFTSGGVESLTLYVDDRREAGRLISDIRVNDIPATNSQPP